MKQQLILAGAGAALLLSLFFFGKTVEKKQAPALPAAAQAEPAFSIDTYLQTAKQKLTVSQTGYVAALENNISRGDLKAQQTDDYKQLAAFWLDSAKDDLLYDYYIAEASKLVNTEKNLTFAARLILDNLRGEADLPKRSWKAGAAIELFDKAIELNPNNDSLKVELGSTYILGKGVAGDGQQTMKGVGILKGVIAKDSMNMEAQLALGIGDVISGQYDKAITRLPVVIKHEPGNIEAMSWLADAYAYYGDKQNAMKWYLETKRLMNNPQFSKEVDERIKKLQ